MINYNKMAQMSQLKYSCLHFYAKNKFKIYCIIFLIVLFLLTGLFTALKITDLEKAMKAVEFSFEAISEGKIYKFSFFIRRYLSILLVMGLLFLFSLNKFSCIIGYILIGYRSFLVALNCTLLVMYMGVGGAINSVIIILPCQILQLVLMSLLFVMLCSIQKEKRNCGYINKNKCLKNLIAILVVSFLVNIIELLLLIIFKATTILII